MAERNFLFKLAIEIFLNITIFLQDFAMGLKKFIYIINVTETR